MSLPTRTTTFDVRLPATADGPGRLLETIEVEVTDNFGEEILTPESSERIEQIKARHLGLMTGADIRAMRDRLQLTQKQLTALLECGEKSLSRWENGHGYPTGIVNKMLRLLDEGFLAPASLAAVAGPRHGLSSERFLRSRKSNIDQCHFETFLSASSKFTFTEISEASESFYRNRSTNIVHHDFEEDEGTQRDPSHTAVEMLDAS